MTTRWRFMDMGQADGPTNMAIDEAILLSYVQGSILPTLRVYQWNPPCLSIGCFQSVSKEVDLEACRQMGVDLVRRPTGGRAILHDVELTYSLVVSEGDPLVGGTILESYNKISLALVEGLALLGVRAELASRKEGTNASGSAACFHSASSYEVTLGGRKLVGSAQLRKNGVLLQQGSLLLDLDPERTLRLLKVTSKGSWDKEMASFRRRVTTLGEAMNREVTFSEVVLAMREGFQRALGVTLESSPLSIDEQALAQRLREDKYASREWNLQI